MRISGASGGSGQFSYQWQVSTDNVSFADVSGATSATFTPSGNQTVTKYYRVKVSDANNTSAFSFTSSLVQTVQAVPTVVASRNKTSPMALTSVVQISGTGASEYRYVEGASNELQSWTASTFINYQPSIAGTSVITVYGRTNGCESSDTVAIQAVVLTPGTVTNPNGDLCEGGTLSQPITATASTGGSGTYTYQWLWGSSNTSVDQTISNATSADLNYQSPLNQSIWFRRRTLDQGVAFYTQPVQVVVRLKPAASISSNRNPSSGNLPDGAEVILTAPTGTGYTYSWTPGNATTSSITVTPQSTVTYTVTVTETANNLSCTNTASRQITIDPLRAGTLSNQSVCSGANPVMISATGSGGGSGSGFTYTWEQSTDNLTWNTISGAVAATYTPSNLTQTTYFKRKIRDLDVTKEAVSTVTVATNPTVTVTPASQTVAPNSFVRITGAGATSWSWSDGTSIISNQNHIDVYPTQTTTYTLTGTDQNSCSNTASAVITVQPFNPGSIGTAQTICSGQTPAGLTSVADASGGSGTITYQWQVSNDGTNWTNIQSATAKTYNPSALNVDQYYRRLATSGSVTSPTTSILVSVTQGPQTQVTGSNLTIAIGDTASLSASGATTYAWSPAQYVLSSPNSALGIANVKPLVTTTFTVTGTSNGCSSTATITVNASELVPGSLSSTGSTTICPGAIPSPINFNVNPSGGSGNYTRQWQSSTDNITYSTIPGATFSTYTPSNGISVSTWYRAVVNDGGVLKETQPVKYTVATPAVLQINATYDTVPPGGGSNVLTVVNTYQSSYEWYTGSVSGQSDASAVSTRTIATLSNQTTYWLKYFDGTCSTQVSKTIYISPLSAGSIGSDQNVCEGSTSAAPLTSVQPASGGTQGSYEYQWESSSSQGSGFAAISGATLATYSPQFAALNGNLYFRRKVTNAGIVAYSNVVTVNRIARPSISVSSAATSNSNLSTSAPTIPNGATITLTASASGSNVQSGATYQWSPSTGLSSTTGAAVQANPSSTVTYTVTGTTLAAPGCSNSATLTVTVDELTPGTVAIGDAGGQGSTSATVAVCAGSAPSTKEIRVTAAPTGGTSPYSYQWEYSSDQQIWQAITPAQNATSAAATYLFNSTFDAVNATRYYRRVVANTGVTKPSASVQVTANPLPNILITAESDVVPPGGTNVLTASGSSGSYTWYIGSTSATPESNTSSNYTIGLGVQTGQVTYIAKGTSSAGCENTYSKTITVAPIVPGVIGTSQNICEGATSVPQITSASAATGGSGSGYAYQWKTKVTGGTWSTLVGATQETYQPTFPSGFSATTQYVRVVTNKGVKDSSNVVTYSFVSKPVITVSATGQPGSTVAIPRGASIQLNATAPAGQPIQSWSWSPSTALSATNTPTTTANPITNTTYVVTGTSSSSCNATGQIVVNVSDLNSGSIIAASTSNAAVSVCRGSYPGAFNQSVAASGGSGTYSYKWQRSTDNQNWQDIALNFNATAQSVNYVPGSNDTLWSLRYYRRVAVDMGVQSASNAIVVSMLPNPSVSVSSNKSNVPPGGSVTLTATGGVSSYQWYNRQVQIGSTQSISVTVPSTSRYVAYTTGANGCGDSAALTITTVALVEGSVGPSQTLCSGGTPSTLNSIAPASGGSGTYVYTWQSTTDLNAAYTDIANANQASYTPGNITTTTYFRRKVSDSGIDKFTTPVSVSVVPNPTVSAAAANRYMPPNGTATLTANGASTYTWTPSTTSLNQGNSQVRVQGSGVGKTTYTALGVDNNNCQGSDTVDVYVRAIVPGTISSSQTVCEGAAPAILTGTASSGGSGVFTYQWQSSLDNLTFTNITGETSQNLVFSSPATVTTYYRRITIDQQVQSFSNTVTLTVNPLPVVTVSSSAPANTICQGSSVTLTALGASTYVWKVGTVQVGTQSVLTESPNTTTVYTVIGTSAQGCANSGTNLTVFVNPAPVVLASTNYSQVPPTAQVNLTATGATSYSWSPSIGLSSTNTASVTATPTSTIRYTVTGTASGCTDTSSVLIQVVPLNGGSIQTSKLVCQGDTLGTVRQVSATTGGTGSGYNYEWEQSTDNLTWTAIPNSNSPTVVLGSTTVLQSISLRRKSTNLGVVAYSNVCVVQPISRPTVLLSPNKTTVPIGGTVQLTASGATSYTFRNALGVVGTTNPVSQQIFSNTNYTVVGRDANGCLDTGYATVQVQRLLPGTIGPAQTICEGGSFNAVQNTASPSGGSGSYVYQWQRSSDQLNWTDVSGATQLNYAPGAQPTTLYLRRKVSDSGVDTTTAVLTMVVNARPNVRASSSIRVVPPGAAITITATGANTYAWSATNSTAFTTVGTNAAAINSTPFTTTTYTVTGTNTATSCQDTGVIQISVVPLVPGTISIASTSVCQGAVPGQMSGATPPSGGSGSYTYQWQSSSDGVIWTSIQGAVSPSFVPVAQVNATTFFRRLTVDMGVSEASNVLTINTISRPTIVATTALPTIPPGATSTLQASGAGVGGTYAWFVQGSQVSTATTLSVTPSVTTSYILEGTNTQGCVNQDTLVVSVVPLDGGTVTTTTNSVCIGNGGVLISSLTAASGGSSVYAYSWERSTDNLTFVQIAGQSGASLNYTQALNTRTYFRRKTLDNGVAAYSNTISVAVNPLPNVVANTATRRIPPGAQVSLTGTGASTYTWTPSASFTNGATGTQVSATLFATSVLTVEGLDNATGCSNTDTIQIVVTPLLGGQIGSDQFICSGSQASTLTSGAPASGGSGTYTYQWQQKSQAQSSFTDIQGATGTTLIPSVLQQTTTYRRKVTDMGVVSYSNEVTVTISPVPNAPTTSDTTYCQSANLTVLVSTRVGAASGHTLRWYATGAGGVADVNAPIYSAAVVGVNDYYVSQVNTTTGCESPRKKVTITTRSLPNAPIVPADQFYCVGQANPSALTATRNSSANSLNWFDSDGITRLTSAPVPNTSAALLKTYYVSETDLFGCTSPQVATRAVVYRPELTMTINQTVSCFGGSNGQITVAATGGLTPYSYQWSKGGTSVTGATQSSIVGQSSGVYQVRVEDARGCFTTDSRTLTQPTDIAVQVTPQNPQCFGDNGTITVLATGGTPGYQYSFDNGVTYQVGTSKSLPFGSYRIKVKDANGCEKANATNPVVLQQATAIAATITATNVSCWGSTDGALTVNPSGGSPSIVNGAPVYQYLWNDDNLQTTRIATGLDSGTYTVTVYDQYGCNRSFTQQVGTPKAIKVTQVAKQDLTCFGNNSGRITVTATGGNVLSYRLNAGTAGSNSIFNGLSAGEYTVTVSDSKNCEVDYQVSRTLTLAQPDQLIVEAIDVDSVSCRNYTDGVIQIFASGGNVKKYSINNGISFVSTSTFGNLSAGTYTVSVSDDKACPATYVTGITQTQVVGQPLLLVVSAITKTDLSCKNSQDGQIVVSASGGNSKRYSLSGGTNLQTSPTFTGLNAGLKTVTVSDVKNCPVTYNTSQNVTLTEPDSLLVTSVVKTDVLCKNAQNGTITVTATGGNVKTYKVVASSSVFQNSSLFNGLSPNTYEVTVRDSKLCTPRYVVSRNVTITEPDSLIVHEAVLDQVSCKNFGDGSVEVTATGGNVKNYKIRNIATAQPSPQFENLTPGNYFLTVSDNNNCPTYYRVPRSFQITEPDSLFIRSKKVTPVSCHGFGDGSVQLTTSGGTQPHQFSLDFSGVVSTQENNRFNGLAPGAYVVSLTDANACPSYTKTANSFNITEPAKIQVQSVQVNDVTCHSYRNGSVLLNAIGGNSPLEYTLYGDTLFSQSSSVLDSLFPGAYTFKVSDSNSCPMEMAPGMFAQLTISQPNPLVIYEIKSNDITCHNFNDGSIVINATGGTAPLRYSLNSGLVYNFANTYTGLVDGIYSIKATDVNNCPVVNTAQSVSSYIVDITNPAPLASAVTVVDALCHGALNGTAEVAVTGGTLAQASSYQLKWKDVNQNVVGVQALLDSVASGLYVIEIRDDNQCLLISQAFIDQPDSIKVQGVVSKNARCYRSQDGEIEVLATGGTGLIYSIDGGTTTQIPPLFTGLDTGIYAVAITDVNGCASYPNGPFQVIITEPDSFYVSGSVLKNIDCYGNATGSISIVASGGNLLEFSIDGGSNWSLSPEFDSLVAGPYSLSVRDSAGCIGVGTVNNSVTLTEPTLLQANALVLQGVKCEVDNSGSAEVQPLGGTLPYSIEWENGDTNFVALGLQGFEYEFTVVDSHLCSYTGTVKIPTTDADCDSIPDFDDGFDDFDGDGLPNFRDEDADGDLLPDIIERDLNRDGIVYDDCDDDGMPNFLDVDYCTVFIPSVFTPNGDGANDKFIIPGIEEYEDNSLMIYDRNGNLVFSKAPYKNEFDGMTNGTTFLTSRDGLLPTGTYYYVLSIPSLDVREVGYFYIQR
jgi:gliding motility-associated-like protein